MCSSRNGGILRLEVAVVLGLSVWDGAGAVVEVSRGRKPGRGGMVRRRRLGVCGGARGAGVGEMV